MEAKTLHVKAGVRYWEDATVNGTEDTDGSRIPFSTPEYWMPTIDLDTGKILSWPKGNTADIHYKVCDDGIYVLKNKAGIEVARIENDYVPDILCPEGGGYGDYIIMKVSEDCSIDNWQLDLSEFESQLS